MIKNRSGFTLVELLIVIVVIAILAAITIVAYNGVQSKARDTSRKTSVANISKALEMYYIQNGRYPSSTCSSGCSSTTSWSATNDASWQQVLGAALVPQYISALPGDPAPDVGKNVLVAGNYGIAYFTNGGVVNDYCGVTGAGQMYMLVYQLEGSQEDKTTGLCSVRSLHYTSKSNFIVAHDGS